MAHGSCPAPACLRPGIFKSGYRGHPAYRLPPDANLVAVAHYLEALARQREVVALHIVLGGKKVMVPRPDCPTCR